MPTALLATIVTSLGEVSGQSFAAAETHALAWMEAVRKEPRLTILQASLAMLQAAALAGHWTSVLASARALWGLI